MSDFDELNRILRDGLREPLKREADKEPESDFLSLLLGKPRPGVRYSKRVPE